MIIPYGKQDINQDDIDAVITALKSDFLTQGPEIEKFEKNFAKYTGAKYAVAVSNGTAALHIAALALGVNEKSKVITTPITFAASANCIKYCGGEVFFCDIDPETFLLDIKKVRTLLEKYPKGTFQGIIPVDFAGYPVNLEEYRKLADEFGLWIIEDSCHSPGGTFTSSDGAKNNCGNGRFAEMSVFSFHPVKHIAAGEGGMITTDDKELYQKLLNLRTHGITKNADLLIENHGGWYYEMQSLGYNYRITDFQAALANSQLNRADAGIQRRRQIADNYTKAFKANSKIKSPFVSTNVEHAYHLYVIQIDNRLELYNHLKANGIYAQIHYVPVHIMPYYKSLGSKVGDFPLAENYYSKCVSLPMYPTLTDAEQTYVINTILDFLK